MKHSLRLLLVLIPLTLFSGCAIIESLFGKPSDSDVLKPNDSGNGEGYGVVRYFRIKPKYQCRDKNGVSITSFKDSLEIDETLGTFTQTGDKCASEPLSKGDIKDLEISNDKIGFKGGIYQKEIK